jgi:hypothetical protein
MSRSLAADRLDVVNGRVPVECRLDIANGRASFLIFWTARSIAMYSTTAGTILEAEGQQRHDDQPDENQPDQAQAALPMCCASFHLPQIFQLFSDLTSS